MMFWSCVASGATVKWAEGGALHVKIDSDEVVAALDCHADEIALAGWRVLVACGDKGVVAYDLSRGLALESHSETAEPCLHFVVRERTICLGATQTPVASFESLLDAPTTRYITRDGMFFARGHVEARVPTPCEWVSGSVRVGSKIHLACGESGLAVYDVSTSTPTLERQTRGPCYQLTTTGTAVQCMATPPVQTTIWVDSAANGTSPERRSRDLWWILPVVLLGVGALAGIVAGVAASMVGNTAF